MFEDVRQALHDLLHGNVPAGERREVLATMKETIVRARMALDDLRESVEVTRKRVAQERRELETVKRRKGLALGVGDTETVTIAERFETQHAEKLAVLEQKLAVQENELALVEREVEEMKSQFKAASAGVGSGLRSGGAHGAGVDPLEEESSRLDQQFSELDRAARRADANATAEAQLAELKRRMGK